MKIKRIKLTNYRLFNEKEISFSSGINLIYGKNAVGKTTIIESIFVSLFGRSFRTNKIEELISLEKSYSNVNILFEHGDVLDINIQENKKAIFYNNKLIKKISDLIKINKIVFFSPDYLTIIKGSNFERLNHIDFFISQLDEEFLLAYRSYNNTCKRKKMILIGNRDKTLIEILNNELSRLIEIIIRKRDKYIKLINNEIDDKITVVYESRFQISDSLESEIKNKLDNSVVEEISRRKMVVKISNELVNVNYNKLDSRKYSSQGEQRETIIKLIITQANIIEKICNIDPIILLDDFFSELDQYKKNDILTKLNKFQVIITSVNSVENKDINNIEVTNE